jgi:hypothetical protein
MEVRARVLAVLPDGIVAQMMHSNAVLKVRWATGSAARETDNVEPRTPLLPALSKMRFEQHQIAKHAQIAREQAVHRGQTVTLRVLSCEPPHIVVQVVAAEETPAPSQEAPGAGTTRRRAFLAPL